MPPNSIRHARQRAWSHPVFRLPRPVTSKAFLGRYLQRCPHPACPRHLIAALSHSTLGVAINHQTIAYEGPKPQSWLLVCPFLLIILYCCVGDPETSFLLPLQVHWYGPQVHVIQSKPKLECWPPLCLETQSLASPSPNYTLVSPSQTWHW